MKMRPDLSSLHAAARRERAAEIQRLLFAPIAAWFRRPKPAPRQAAPVKARTLSTACG
jgi:hypothetical protein